MKQEVANDKAVCVRSFSGRDAFLIAFLALAYFLTYCLAFLLPDAKEIIMLVWPAGGIGLTAFLLNPRRLWPFLVLAFYVAGVTADVFIAGRSLMTGVGYMTANLAESVACAWLILRVGGTFQKFGRVKEVTALLAGVVFVNAFSACIGAGTSVLSRGASFGSSWLSWYIVDGLGMLLLGPFFVTWISITDLLAGLSIKKTLEGIGCLSLWIIFAWCIFWQGERVAYLHPYALVALLAWTATRFGQRGVTMSLVLLFAMVVQSPMITHRQGFWPWEAAGSANPMLDLQVFLGFMATVGYLIASGHRERDLAVKSLRDESWRTESIIEETHIGTWEWNVQTGETAFNEVWAQIIGYTLEELAPVSIKTWEKFVHPEDLKRSSELLERHFAGELPYYDCECRMRHKNGLWVWVHDRGRVVTRTNDGKPLMMFGTHFDITERKSAEAAEQIESTFTEAIIDSIPGAFYVLDENGRYVRWNAYQRDEIVGKPEAQIAGTNAIDTIHPDDRALIQTKIANVLKNGAVEIVEGRVLLRGGPAFRWLLMTGRRMMISGRPFLVGIGIDMSERKLGEKALQESEARYKALFSRASEGILLADLQINKFRFANPSICRMLGYSEEELLRMGVADIHPEESMERVLSEFEAMRRGEQRIATDIPCRRKDGTVFYADISGSLIELDGQQCNFGIFTDITERKKAEAALRESEVRFRSLFESMEEGFALHEVLCDAKGVPVDYRFLNVNPAFERLTGLKKEGLIGRRVREVLPQTEELWIERYGHVALTGEPAQFEAYTASLDKHYRIAATCPRKGQFAVIFDDITEKKWAEEEREYTLRLLGMANEQSDLHKLMEKVIGLMKEVSGCWSVGIRLKEGDDYPYYVTTGFPEKFVEQERYLCSRDAQGAAVKDAAGNPVLECMCGNILCGRFDPKKPFFTKHGSFWTNGTTELLASTTDADRQARTRNRCNGEGYESVALMPLRLGKETFGLLQCNDQRKGMFSARKVAVLERLADHLAIALAHRRATELLGKSELRYRSLFSSMVEGLAYCRMLYEEGQPKDFIYLEVNDSFTGQTGLKDVIGRKVSEVIPGILEQDPELIRRYGRVAQGDFPEKFEVYVKALDQWFSISVYCPERGFFVAVFNVITNRKRAEEALEVQRSFNAAMLENAYAGIVACNEKGELILFNRLAREWHGADPLNIAQTEWAQHYNLYLEDGVTPMDVHTIPLARAFRGEIVTGFSMVIAAEGQPKRPVLAYAGPVIAENGRVLGAIAVMNDITEMKRKEEALRQANESLAIAQRASGAGAWDWDMRTGELTWSPEFFLLFGLENSLKPSFEVWRNVVYPEDRHVAEERLNAAIRERRPLSSEYRIVMPSGEMRWIHALGEAEYGEDGKPCRMSGFCLDITVRKNAEVELTKLMEAKTKFTATVSHELRSPLATIKAATDLVFEGLAGPVNEEQKDVLGTAKDSIDRLGRLINNVLVFQKLEAGKMGYDMREGDLNDFIVEAHKHVELLAGKRASDLVLELGRDLPRIKFDKDRLFQVLINLVANAIKYSASGSIVIQTRREKEDVCVIVRDFGLGIEAGNLDKIFEPFSQIENNRKGGTGLGLAISKEIILAHGGRIWAESKAGKGSVFYFTLPVGH